MSARILDGKVISEAIKREVMAEMAKLSYKPCLAVIRVGDNPASAVYVANKIKTAEQVGIHSEHHHFPATISQESLVDKINELNDREDVDGILVQLPLPTHINELEILERIDPKKDVDGFHPVNAGRLLQGNECLSPCTPAGVIEILKRSNIQISSKHAVVVGRSNIVGKPMAVLLLQENATVTICHSRTENLSDITRQADILVAAIGKPGFIRARDLKDGVVIADVGINQIKDEAMLHEFFDGEELRRRLEIVRKKGATIVGDVNPKEASYKASAFTPVPGGVGLLTVAMLMKNTLKASKLRREAKQD